MERTAKGYPVPKYEHVEPFGGGGCVLMTKLPGRSGRVSRARAGAVGTRAATQREAVPVRCAAEHLARGDHLWFCIYADDDCRGRLWRHLLGVAEPATIAFYAAHVIIGFVSGSIAHTHERIDRRLDAAHRAVADLAELGLPIDVP